MTDEEQAAAAAEAARIQADKDASDEVARIAAEAAKKASPDPNKPTDNEARLLRELMDYKTKLTAASATLKTFDGINPEDHRALMLAKKTAEDEALRKVGDFDALRLRMAEEHDREKAVLLAAQEVEKEGAKQLKTQIKELTIGAAFSASKFIVEDTILTPSKARRVYEDFFEVENGKIVPYDAPRDATSRVPLVNGRGDPLQFDDAMKRIVEADVDRDELLRSKAKSGSGAGGVNTGNGAGGGNLAKVVTNTDATKGVDRIAALLAGGALKKN